MAPQKHPCNPRNVEWQMDVVPLLEGGLRQYGYCRMCESPVFREGTRKKAVYFGGPITMQERWGEVLVEQD